VLAVLNRRFDDLVHKATHGKPGDTDSFVDTYRMGAARDAVGAGLQLFPRTQHTLSVGASAVFGHIS
jgi:hypothetical protein